MTTDPRQPGDAPAAFRRMSTDSPTAPAAFVTVHAAQTTDRTRLRVAVTDDGNMVRVHVHALTSAGAVDVALAPAAAAALGHALLAAADDADRYWTPTPADYAGALRVVKP